MRIRVFKEFSFSAAHCLDGMPEGHPCKAVHGHNYKVRLEVQGKKDNAGMVVDFREIKNKVQPLIDQLDHSNLNDIMPVTTSEGIAEWFYLQLRDKLPGLVKIEIRETDTCGAVWMII